MTIRLYIPLFVGVAAISVAAILIRLADADPIAVAACRLLIGGVVLVIPAIAYATYREKIIFALTTQFRKLLVPSVFLSAHFVLWITSLSMTSVASSVVLVTTTPVFIAVAARFWLADTIRLTTWTAIAMTLSGAFLIGFSGWNREGNSIVGDCLAVGGAVAMAGYLLSARRLRSEMDSLSFAALVYLISGAMVFSIALASNSQFKGLGLETYLWIGLAALIPQVIGHTIIIWCLTRIRITTVSLAIRLEPVIATLIAIPVLAEIPEWVVLPGSLLVLGGVYLAIREERSLGFSL